MTRAQISVELFLVFSLFIVLVLWFTNYVNVFYGDLSEANQYAAGRALSASIVGVANEACVSKANISFRMPCVLAGSSGAAVNLTADNASLLNVSMGGVSVTEYGSCIMNGSLVSFCNDTAGDWVCFYENSYRVSFSRGRCV